MHEIRPLAGINLRLSPYDVSRNNWILMQNMFQNKADEFEQIPGSSKYHGSGLDDTYSPSAIMPYYNNDTGDNHVLTAVGSKIFKKLEGTNEFTEIYSNLRPNLIKSHVNLSSFGRSYIAHPDGLLEYDGVDIKKVNNGPKLRWIIFSLETNRAFGILDKTPLVLAYTDDVSETGGVPSQWNELNLQAIPPTDGDELEVLDFVQGRLVLALGNSIYIQYINGPITNWRFEKIESDVGCIAPKTWKKVGTERWFLGFSPKTGRGIYSFDGRSVRLISYDIEPLLNRINESRIEECCAEVYDKYYYLSFPLDFSIENNTTIQLDVLKSNPETQAPNIYGPHTFGFNSSAILNTKKFKGEFLMGKKVSGEAFVVKQDDSMTFDGTPGHNDGSLIPTKLVSGIIDTETINGELVDENWIKRYGRIRASFPPQGTWKPTVELYTDYNNEMAKSYEIVMDGGNTSLESFILGADPLDNYALGEDEHLEDLRGKSLQLKVSNQIGATKVAFRKIEYEVRASHREKTPARLNNA